MKHNLKLSFYGIIVVLIVLFSYDLDVNLFDLFNGFSNLIKLGTYTFPPDWSLFTVGFVAIVETLKIAFLGTVFGMILSLPFGLLGSRNLFSQKTTVVVRVFLAAVRVLPSLLWAVVFVIMVGPGPFAGVLAMTLYTMGYLAKLQYESIEGISPEPLEAVFSMGASRFQVIRFVVLPEAANNLISQLLFMFEYNVRASSILGFVGAGGVGFYIMNYLKVLMYDKVAVLLLVVLITILIMDYVSVKIRDRYLVESRVCE